MENTTAISDSEDPFADFEDFCLLADKSCLKDFTMPPVPETSLEKAMTDNANNCEKVPLLEQIKPCVEESLLLRKNLFDVFPQPNEPSTVLNGTLENRVNSNLEPMETSGQDVVPTTTNSLNGNILDEFSGTNGEFSMTEDLSGIIDSLVDEEMEVEQPVNSLKEWTLETSKTQDSAHEHSTETSLIPSSSSEVEKPNTQDAKVADPKESEEIDDFTLEVEETDDDLEQKKTDKDLHPPVEKHEPAKENVFQSEKAVLESEKTAEEAGVVESEKSAEDVVLETEKTAEGIVLDSEKTADEAVVVESEKTTEEVVVPESEKTAEEVVLDSEKTADEAVVLESAKTAEGIVLESEKTGEEVTYQTEKVDVNTNSGEHSEELNITNKTGSKSIEVPQSEQSVADKMTLNTVEYNGEIENAPTDIKSSPNLVESDAPLAMKESATEVKSENMEIEIVKETCEAADSFLKNSDETEFKKNTRLNSMDEVFPSNLIAETDAEINRRGKRENDDVSNHNSKKVKTTATTSEEVLHFFKDPNNDKITITRKLLDEIVLIKLTELLTEVGDFGFARNKAEATELERENLKKQKCAVMKTMDDQRKVVRKFTEDRKSAKSYTNNVIPAKVTRSVGLQVCTVGHRFVNPPKPIPPPPGPLPKTFSPAIAQNRQPKPLTPIAPINRPLSKTTTPTNKPIIIRQNARKTTTPVTPTFSPRPMNVEVKAVTPRTPSDVIDLTEDPRKASLKPTLNGVKKSSVAESFLQQALAIKKPELKPPFPPVPPTQYPPSTVLPPKPMLRISRTNADQKSGIMLSWHFTVKETTPISKFQVYSYQEGSDSGKDVWKKVGDVDALILPMACTLTQFKEGYKYYFSVRAIDKNAIKGPFSEPNCIKLFPRKTVNSL